MGYNTTFRGEFTLDKFLKPEHKAYLRRFAEIQHVPLDEEKIRNYPDPLREIVGLPVGEYGKYFTGKLDPYQTGNDALLLFAPAYYSIGSPYDEDAILKELETRDNDASWPPSDSCQWVPTVDGRGIEWDQGEKFYGYVSWLRFLLEHFLLPWGYELSGEVSYQGEQGEHGRIIVAHNEVSKVIDGDSRLPREQERLQMNDVRRIHWMTLGSLSDGARQAILDIDGIVLSLHDEPPVVLVGIPYDLTYYQRFGHDDLMIWMTEGMKLHSQPLRLEWSHNHFLGKSWDGFPRQRLILPGEPYDPIVPQMK